MSMNKILVGDCLVKLKELEDNSVDSIVTDPPYELGFMGKTWDKTGIANNVEMWKECLRVLKPGGHLLAFSGTRTYHRMAVAIEDAGFEVRDMIEWVYGCLSADTEVLTKDGFKHFHKITQDDIIRVYDTQNDIYKWEKPQRWSQYVVEQDTAFRIKSDTTDQIVSRNHNCIVEREGKLLFVKSEDLLQMEQVPVLSGDISILQEGQGKLLHPELLWQGEGLVETILSERVGQEASRNGVEWGEEPSVERGANLQKEKGEICRPENKVCEMSERVSNNGEKGRVCNGTQIESSTGDTKTADKNGVCSSHQSRCNGQQDTELNAIQDERGTQEVRTRTTYNTTLATIEKIEYSGIIFCPTVSTGAFVARRNGQVFITGNSGFPKSLNIGKAVDKMQGNEREVVGEKRTPDGKTWSERRPNGDITGYTGNGTEQKENTQGIETKGTSEWEGWGTALKPAHEPICMARKPLAEKTVAENVLKYGTGGINIDESRVSGEYKWRASDSKEKGDIFKEGSFGEQSSLGRFPANLIHDNSEEVRECFPEQKSSGNRVNVEYKNPNKANVDFGGGIKNDYNDSGNASRFFKSIKQDLHCSLCYDTIDTYQLTKNICNNTNVNNVEKSSETTQAITESTALKNATGKVNENLVQNVKSAGNLCDLCGTSIAQRLVAIMQDQSQESTLGELSMPEHKKQILEKCLVSFVELRGNTDTIPTMENLNLLFGYVLNATEEYTQKCEDTKSEDKNQWKSLIYKSKASKSERNKGCEGLYILKDNIPTEDIDEIKHLLSI